MEKSCCSSSSNSSSSSSNSLTLTAPTPFDANGNVLDLYAKRRHLLKIQILEREIGLLQEELKSIDELQPASRCCKELDDFVAAKMDPFMALNEETPKSNFCWKMFCYPWTWCFSGFKTPKCCSCNFKLCRCCKNSCKSTCGVSCLFCCFNSSICNCKNVNFCCNSSKPCCKTCCM
ncbi:hypothetical protein M5689_020389 [Euphorbia peplus]|nr:hypothetical protein M5689_020389 [Euphorbia peplus]